MIARKYDQIRSRSGDWRFIAMLGLRKYDREKPCDTKTQRNGNEKLCTPPGKHLLVWTIIHHCITIHDVLFDMTHTHCRDLFLHTSIQVTLSLYSLPQIGLKLIHLSCTLMNKNLWPISNFCKWEPGLMQTKIVSKYQKSICLCQEVYCSGALLATIMVRHYTIFNPEISCGEFGDSI